jgi:hypothetical protein
LKPFSEGEIIKEWSKAVADVVFPDKNYITSSVLVGELRNLQMIMEKAWFLSR